MLFVSKEKTCDMQNKGLMDVYWLECDQRATNRLQPSHWRSSRDDLLRRCAGVDGVMPTVPTEIATPGIVLAASYAPKSSPRSWRWSCSSLGTNAPASGSHLPTPKRAHCSDDTESGRIRF